MTKMTEPTGQHDALDETGEGIDLLELAVVLLSEWRLVVICTFISCLLGLVYVLRLHTLYEATATILPHERSVADVIPSFFARTGPGSLYIGLLQSRTVEDNVIDRVHLMDLYHLQSRASAREMLAGMSTFSVGTDTMLKITVHDAKAKEAALIANAYLESLEDENEKMESQQAQQRSNFFEGQVSQEKAALVIAEENLEKLQLRTGLISPGSQTATALGEIAGARAELDAMKVQLAVMLQRDAPDNPEVEQMRTRIAQTEANERTLESSKVQGPTGAEVPAAQAPEATLEYERASREVSFHEARMTSLLNEYQSARLTEATSTSAFQVVDHAIEPESKTPPPRLTYMMFWAGFGVICGMMAVVFKLLYYRAMSDPLHRAHLKQLQSSFRLSR